MKIAIVGASGRTGIDLVEHAVARGHDVTAVVRSPDKLASMTTKPTTVVRADAHDVAAQTEAFRGTDVVVFVLGHSSTSGSDVQSTGIRTTIAAMHAAGAVRLVAVSASGHTTDGDGALTRMVLKPMLGLFLRDQFADMRQMEREISRSDLQWTIVRPPMLTSRPAHGEYRSQITQNVRGGTRITRVDLADAILDSLVREDAMRAVVAVAN